MQRGEVARPDGGDHALRAQLVERIADGGLGAFPAVALLPQVAADDIADAGRGRIPGELLGQRARERDQLAGLLVQRGEVTAAVLLIAAQRVRDPVADLVVGEAVLPGVHGLLVLQDGRDQGVVVRPQAAEAQPFGFHFILLNFHSELLSKRCGICRTVSACVFCFYFVPKMRSPASPRPGTI